MANNFIKPGVIPNGCKIRVDSRPLAINIFLKGSLSQVSNCCLNIA